MYQLKPSEVRTGIISCMEAGLVPYVTSSPGLGKSSVVAQIAKDFNLILIDLRLSQCAPEDLMGLPMKEGTGAAARATFVPFNTFPTEGDAIPEGYDGWILFCDEMNAASRAVQAAAYKLMLDRMVGQAKLHENCFVVAAGNLATDRAIVNTLSTAMQSRIIHMEMIVDHPDFMKHAIKEGYDFRILGFLEFQPSKLQDFKPDHTDRTFACPRTWEFASRLIKGKTLDTISLPLLAGTLSDGVALEFYTFMKEYANLPSYGTIRANPKTAPVPIEPSTQYALITMMLDRLDKSNFPDVIDYVHRLPPEFQVVYFRGVLARFPDMHRDKKFIGASAHIPKYVNDDEEEEAA